MVTASDPKFARSMEHTEDVIRRFRNAYRELAGRDGQSRMG